MDTFTAVHKWFKLMTVNNPYTTTSSRAKAQTKLLLCFNEELAIITLVSSGNQCTAENNQLAKFQSEAKYYFS